MRLFKAKCWENLRHHQWSSHPQCHIILPVIVFQGQDSSELIALLHLTNHEARVRCLKHHLGERWLPTTDITTRDCHHICWEEDWKALVIEKTDNNQAAGISIVYEWLVSIKSYFGIISNTSLITFNVTYEILRPFSSIGYVASTPYCSRPSSPFRSTSTGNWILLE